MLDLDDLVARIKADVKAELLAELPREFSGEVWPQFMSIETAARYLDVAPGRLRKLVARRAIPFAQEATGCRVSFSRDDLDHWMRDLRITTNDEGGNHDNERT